MWPNMWLCCFGWKHDYCYRYRQYVTRVQPLLGHHPVVLHWLRRAIVPYYYPDLNIHTCSRTFENWLQVGGLVLLLDFRLLSLSHLIHMESWTSLLFLSTMRRRAPSFETFVWKCFRDFGISQKYQRGLGIWNGKLKQGAKIWISTKKKDLSTNTLGIWTSCRGLFPSFRAWLRFRILRKERMIRNFGTLHKLTKIKTLTIELVVKSIAIYMVLWFFNHQTEVSTIVHHLSSHHAHLLLKHQTVEAFVRLKIKDNQTR